MWNGAVVGDSIGFSYGTSSKFAPEMRVKPRCVVATELGSGSALENISLNDIYYVAGTHGFSTSVLKDDTTQEDSSFSRMYEFSADF